MRQIDYDFHTHTTYSDGSDVAAMVDAAEAAGLAGIGFTDHCVVYDDPFGRAERTEFDRTYRERRADIRELRAEADVEVYDGVEVNYDPNHEAEIREFLAEASFDYAIGSVHYAGSYDIMHPDALADASAATRRDAVDTYFDWQVRLVASGLFDVVGHPDLPVRAPHLRAVVDEADYERLADALADADAVPEINGKMCTDTGGILHPRTAALEHFVDAGVPFVVGTDSHAPERISETLGRVADRLDGREVPLVGPNQVV